jgi:hypothetical protein
MTCESSRHVGNNQRRPPRLIAQKVSNAYLESNDRDNQECGIGVSSDKGSNLGVRLKKLLGPFLVGLWGIGIEKITC